MTSDLQFFFISAADIKLFYTNCIIVGLQWTWLTNVTNSSGDCRVADGVHVWALPGHRRKLRHKSGGGVMASAIVGTPLKMKAFFVFQQCKLGSNLHIFVNM